MNINLGFGTLETGRDVREFSNANPILFIAICPSMWAIQLFGFYVRYDISRSRLEKRYLKQTVKNKLV